MFFDCIIINKYIIMFVLFLIALGAPTSVLQSEIDEAQIKKWIVEKEDKMMRVVTNETYDHIEILVLYDSILELYKRLYTKADNERNQLLRTVNNTKLEVEKLKSEINNKQNHAEFLQFSLDKCKLENSTLAEKINFLDDQLQYCSISLSEATWSLPLKTSVSSQVFVLKEENKKLRKRVEELEFYFNTTLLN